jgi:hypothetical protein
VLESVIEIYRESSNLLSKVGQKCRALCTIEFKYRGDTLVVWEDVFTLREISKQSTARTDSVQQPILVGGRRKFSPYTDTDVISWTLPRVRWAPETFHGVKVAEMRR